MHMERHWGFMGLGWGGEKEREEMEEEGRGTGGERKRETWSPPAARLPPLWP